MATCSQRLITEHVAAENRMQDSVQYLGKTQVLKYLPVINDKTFKYEPINLKTFTTRINQIYAILTNFQWRLQYI